jgi:2-keto-4-pentenoate hydratase/2-oxohepta-3-ene-1,7-dioic acid hydratase in catechol pathway
MKYCRFISENGPSYGLVEEREGEFWITGRLASPWAVAAETGGFVAQKLSGARLLAPVVPSKILCVGRNYRDHAAELGNAVPVEPLLFFKPPSSLLPAGGAIQMPKAAGRIDFEGELAVVIAKRARHLSAESDLTEYVLGYTLANDVTARELQKKDGQWTRAKGFDTFCPVGPIVDTDFDPGVFSGSGTVIETHVNGELRQHGSTADFIFPLAELLAYITAAMTLEPGDLLLTGTPAGVGPLAPGDRVEVSMAGLVTLANTVQAEES